MAIQQYEKQKGKLASTNRKNVLYVPLPEHLRGFRFYQGDTISSRPAVNSKLSEDDQTIALDEFSELIEEVLFYNKKPQRPRLPGHWAVYSCKIAEQLEPFANSAIVEMNSLAEVNADDLQELPPPEPCRNCPVFKKKAAYCRLDINRFKAGQPQVFDTQFWTVQCNSSESSY